MSPQSAFLAKHWKTLTATLAVATVAVVAVATQPHWLSAARSRLVPPSNGQGGDEGHQDESHAGHSHAGHNHGDAGGHEGHEEENSLELSSVAWKNIGLKTGVVELSTYVKTVLVPAVVVERPGWSQIESTAPFTGMVTRVHRIEGEAVLPGQALFDIRLTHEDLVVAQRDFLRSAQELDVIKREVARLESAGEGVVAGRRVLEQKYEQEKTQAALHAQLQGLLLHGLTQAQIDEILETRQLLQSLTITAPPFGIDPGPNEGEFFYHVQEIFAKRGQHVNAGDPLGVLADHRLLYVEGQAFEDDEEQLVQASRAGWPITVSAVSAGRARGKPQQLRIMYVADHIDSETRAWRFYLGLPNHLVRDAQENNHRFVSWKYRPGQRMEVKIPLGEPWKDQIVLPPDAIVEEGAEAFVFEQNGEHFDRLPVHVIYRDKDAIVVENDRSLLGRTLAMSGAYQMHLAIKGKSAGGVDPHAGHNH